MPDGTTSIVVSTSGTRQRSIGTERRARAMSNVFDHGRGGGGEQGQQQQGDTLLCYFHPRELLVGVCAHCLRERLLLLLASNSKQQEGQGGGRARVPADGASYLSARPYCRAIRRVRTGSIVSVLALGSSFIHRLDSSSSRHHHHHPAHLGGSHDGNVDCKVNPGGDDAAGVEDDDASIASLDDSFISIKFEDNGKATWANAQSLQTKPDHAVDGRIAEKAPSATTTTAVVEHVRRGGGAARWRKQVVGRLLQLARWKRASSSSGGKAQPAACQVQRAEQQRSSKGRGGRGWIRSLTRRRAAHGERAWS